MEGFEAAYKGRSLANLPVELAKALTQAGGGSLILRVRQGNEDAVDEALKLIADRKAPPAKRLPFVQVFGEAPQPRSVQPLLDVVTDDKDPSLRMAALTSLQRYNEPRIGQVVASQLPSFPEDVREAALTLLVSRGDWARQLLAAVDSGKVNANLVPPAAVRQLTVHRGEDISKLVAKHWGRVQGATTEEMASMIERLGAVVQSGSGDPYAGKLLFQKTCAKCHVLFGQGGRIGPDLTAYKRDDVRRMLVNVVNPSAEIREGFETLLAITDDGRAVSGFRVDKDNRVLVLRGVDGQNIVLELSQIDELQRQPKSIMPEGLLKELNDQQVRDLFAFLRSSQPLNN